MSLSLLNQRVLIVDDEEVVRDSLRESLVPQLLTDPGLDDAAGALFGETSTPRGSQTPFTFEIQEAANGAQALERVRVATNTGQPFAVIFMDMRMPGMDGLATVQEIRHIDPRAEIVFVTAYSDHSIEELVERAGPNVGYYCKPFAPDEIRQVAIKAAFDWNRNRDLEKLITMVAGLRASESQMHVLLANILHQISAIMGAGSVLIARRLDAGELSIALATGRFLDVQAAADAIRTLRLRLIPETTFPLYLLDERLIIFHLNENHFVALLENGASLKSDKLYLLTLFLETAGASLENSRLQREVAEKEHLFVLGQALSGIVHDLRNPVGAMQSIAELQKGSLEKNDIPEATELCNLIQSSSHDAMDLLEDLLDFTRGQRGEPEPVSVPLLLQQVKEKAGTVLKPYPVTWRFEIPSDGTILAEPKKLLRVFLNLLKNSAEAVAGSGQPGGEVVLSAEAVGGEWVFAVTDNGPGIPAEALGNIFRPFFTSGKDHGTGLGLAIVKQILESHNTRPEVVTKPGCTTFSFRLPKGN